MARAPEPVVAMYQNKDDHPHTPPGSPQGGQFATKSSTPPPAAKPAAKGAAKAPVKPAAKSAGKPAPKAAPAPPAPVAITQTLSRKGKHDPGQVHTLQQLLAALKIGDGRVDGVFGANTEQAVKDLQTKLGVRPTGHASPALARRLADAAALSPCVKASGQTVSLVMASGSPLGPSMTGVELARPGTWHLSSGKRTFTADNLKDAADFFAASGQTRIPLGFGHSDSRFDGDPAFGWVSNIRYAEDAKGPVLLGDLVDLDDWVAAAAPTRWPNRSIEGFANLDWNGRTYSLALTRLALLGSTPPAMPILRSLADLREAVAAAAADSGAEWVSAAAPSTQDAMNPALEAAAPTTTPKETRMDPAKFRDLMGLEDASDDEVMTALAEAGFVPQSDTPEPVAASGATPISGLAPGTMVLASSVWDQTQETIKNLTAFVEKAERNERDAILAEAVKVGKFTPAQKPHFSKLWDADPKGTRSLIESLTRNSALAVAASGYAGDEAEEADREFSHLFPPKGA
jgi:hypothetical protein